MNLYVQNGKLPPEKVVTFCSGSFLILGVGDGESGPAFWVQIQAMLRERVSHLALGWHAYFLTLT